MADLVDWHKSLIHSKKKSVVKGAEYILKVIATGDCMGTPKKIKHVETDGGMLIAWWRGNNIHHYLAPDQATIIERGIEAWPRGRTKHYEAMCAVLDAELIDGMASERARKAQRAFALGGPIATARTNYRPRVTSYKSPITGRLYTRK